MKLLAAFLFILAALFPHATSAATTAASAAKAPLEVVVLGSGGPRPFGRADEAHGLRDAAVPGRETADATPWMSRPSGDSRSARPRQRVSTSSAGT